jgi:hypothetical protein
VTDKPTEKQAARRTVGDKVQPGEVQPGHPDYAQDTHHLETASTRGMPENDIKALLAQVKDLQSKLTRAEEARTEVEAAALAAAEMQGMMIQGESIPVPTGKKVTVKRLKEYKIVGYKDDGREILKPMFKDVELSTYFYKINMPPVGGLDLKINQLPFYHGQTVEVDIDTLRSIMEQVGRLWRHDADIHQSEERVYRKHDFATLSPRGRIA